MSIVADTYQYVVGVDTHAATHTLALIQASNAALQTTCTFPASPTGMNRAIGWISQHTDGPTLIVIEGIGSYGAQLASVAAQAGYRIVEPFPIPANLRRGHGKTDPFDAHLIGKSVLDADINKLRQPRDQQGIRQALRVLTDARQAMNTERTRAINQLTALARTTNLGIDARKALTKPQIRSIATWHTPTRWDPNSYPRREAIRLARHIRTINTELADNQTRLEKLLAITPAGTTLLNIFGIGPITAAIILVAWSHPGRIHSEAAFAALAGVNPIPASSGNTTRHRLNRGGDRTLNKALTAITRTRLSKDPATRTYRTKRLAQGKTPKEITRILKRYLARQLFRQLTQATT